ncbi:hypothetical protein ACOSP7_005324 [Xanthoceras sorbifolium]|uniref:Alpha/beta hydrolase fold-3 domain-containing protein n=1 Tax=Xanthoceras sorbifolium TaxID=99658 RepID=A0ABQ8IF77_9ROSI|nr:hypothetical protein JRO89_XS02G0064000 [Xanthoceras sorbifolium]
MDSSKQEIAHDFSPFFIVYKDSRVVQLKVPSSLDPKTNVESKDVVYSPHENGLSARLYIPRSTHQNQKLPLLVYFHGGCFCIESAFSPTYHNYLNSLVAEANVIAVSVEYRQAPENPVPCPHDDSWTALKWVASHFNGQGPEDWLNRHADFQRVFLVGDSAGANIAHRMGIKHGLDKLEGANIAGIILCQPYFLGEEPVGDETNHINQREKLQGLWRFTCPSTSGCDDPWISPGFDPNLASLGCTKVLVFVAEKDFLRARGVYYTEKLKESGWDGDLQVVESKGEDHIFHLINPTCENAVVMLKKIVAFINQLN